jgi:hypothetical protein
VTTLKRWSLGGVLLGLLLCLFVAVVVLVVAPSTYVGCKDASPWNGVAIRVSQSFGAGHVDTDGTIPEQCAVPRRGVWGATAVLVGAGLTFTLWLSRRHG